MEQNNGKKRRGRRAYLDDFHRDLSGKYTYDGPLYSYSGEKPRKTLLRQLWGLCAAMLLCIIAIGFVPAPGVSTCVYVTLPYAVTLVAAVSVCWALGELSTGKDPLREYVYEASVKKIPLRAMLTAVFAAAAILGEAVFLILNGVGGVRIWFALLVMALLGGACACALLIRKFLPASSWVLTRARRGEGAKAPSEKKEEQTADADGTEAAEKTEEK